MISIIVVVDKKLAIGNGGDQLVYISADLKRFKELTTGHPIIMGRKTNEALPHGALPNRKNIVLTNNKLWKNDRVFIASSVNDAITLCAGDDAFVIGGGQIYSLFMPKASELYLTQIDHTFDTADTYFPEIDPNEWHEAEIGEWQTDEKSGLKYRYVKYSRI